MRTSFLIFLLAGYLVSPVSALAAAPADSFQIILAREREVLLSAPPLPADQIAQLRHDLGSDGRWSDIDYQSQQHGGWSPSKHLERTARMCRALVDEHSSLQGNIDLASAIDRALDDWFSHRYQCPNWWYNQIGVPGLMRQIILLLDVRLNGDRLRQALEIMHQYKVEGEGANMTWAATLALNYGCLTRDEALVDDSAARIFNEIKVSTGEGIQSDFSFHQHGPRLQSFGYGSAYLTDASRLAWTLGGTKWAMPSGKIDLLVDYAVKGMSWMSRWDFTVPGTVDRGISRAGVSRIDSLAESTRLLALAAPARHEELDAVTARVERRAPPLEGFRSYPDSDFACYQRPAFSFFVKTVSTRTRFAETGLNNENLHGQEMSCGDTYFLRNGDEYNDLMPVWDWNRLPGVTAFEGWEHAERRGFTGAVGDGTSGLSVMDLRLQDAGPASGTPAANFVEGCKAYFCHGDTVVCLTGGLKSSVASPKKTQTALNQCALRGPVIVADEKGGSRTVSGPGEQVLKGTRWIYHDGLVYLPLDQPHMVLNLDAQEGSWRSINEAGSAETVKAPVFMPLYPTATSTRDSAPGYAVLSCPDAAKAGAVADSPGFHTLRNDPGCQAVQWDDGTLMASFPKPGELHDARGKLLLAVDQPCLLLCRGGKIFASEPLHRAVELHVNINAAADPLALALPDDGIVVEAQLML